MTEEVDRARQVVSAAWGRYRASWRIDAYGRHRGGVWPHQAAATLGQAVRYLRNLEAEVTKNERLTSTRKDTQ